jgi:hypothetical protein
MGHPAIGEEKKVHLVKKHGVVCTFTGAFVE